MNRIITPAIFIVTVAACLGFSDHVRREIAIEQEETARVRVHEDGGTRRQELSCRADTYAACVRDTNNTDGCYGTAQHLCEGHR